MTKGKLEKINAELENGSDILLNDFMVLEKEEVQNVYGGEITKPSCLAMPSRCNSFYSGIPDSGAVCGPDPDYVPDVEDIEIPDPDDEGIDPRPFASVRSISTLVSGVSAQNW